MSAPSDRPPGPPPLDPDPQLDPLTPSVPLAGWDEPALDPALLEEHSPPRPLRLIRKPNSTPPPTVKVSSASLVQAALEAKVLPEDGLAFTARVVDLPPTSWLVSDLVPTEGVFLFHGRPRSMKSLSLLELAFSLAHGRPVFGSPRFSSSRSARVLFVTEEDPERIIYERLEKIRLGAKLSFTPNLRFLIRRGISLDLGQDRDALLSVIGREGFEVLILEPMRSLTSTAESTSGEFKPVGDWLKQIQNTTSCKAIGMGAHWRKPSKAQAGGRSESLSGAALFSFSDCLISCQKVAWNEVLCVPEDYKPASDPPSFLIRWNTPAGVGSSGQPIFGDWITPELVDVVSPEDAMMSATRGKLVAQLLTWLEEHPWSTAYESAKGAKLSKNTSLPTSVYSLLAYLESQSAVRRATKEEVKVLGRRPGAKLFAVASTPEVLQVLPTTPSPPRGGVVISG